MIRILPSFQGIRQLSTFVSCWIALACSAQTSSGSFLLQAIQTEQHITVDGVLNEAAWQSAPVAGNFTESDPQPNTPSSQQTEVKVLYSHDAIYVGAFMYDSAPDSILAQMSQRDELGNTDSFGMWFSCFRDGINAFKFSVTPAGIQLDAQVSAFGEDNAWNAVWQCNTSISEQGWCAEFKIPFSALRFPHADEQIWDVNFNRVIRRHREQSYWRPVDPRVDGTINQSGTLSGITGIEPPVRLFFYPYGSAYYELRSTDEGIKSATSYNGGMDLKLGLSKAFTLDMTLVPDFGQVVADNKVFNLSPFEVQFVENRQFFTEGTELFNKGGLFYSRRIGGLPIGYSDVNSQLEEGEVILENPLESRLINATKISGRTSGGLGIGVVNSLSNASYALVEAPDGSRREIETSPLTNYNVTVLDQNLRNNSYFTLINTNVIRNGNAYDANVLGTEFRLRDSHNRIEASGGGAWSSKHGIANLEDDGFRANLGLSKIGGNWTYSLKTSAIDDRFNPNDLGFLTRNNSLTHTATLAYATYQPKGRLNRWNSNISVAHNSLFLPNQFTHLSITGSGFAFTRAFNAGGYSFSLTPTGTRDYFEPREPVDRYYAIPRAWSGRLWYSTDYRKRFAYDISLDAGRIEESGRWNYNFNLEPRFRVNDKLMLIYSYTWNDLYNDVGWVNTQGDEIILGRRFRHTEEHLLTANYVFTNRMGLSFRLRHYWSYVAYNAFFELAEDGSLNQAGDYDVFGEDGTSIHDGNYNAFNIDMVFRWVFAPGSEINVVWKNIIEDLSTELPENFGANLDRTLSLPQTNSFSIRVLYFIDYYNLRNGGRFIRN